VSGLLVIISGPAGVGKSTICRRMSETLPAQYALSETTRVGKPQDSKGKPYIFVDEPTFRKHLEEGAFIEYAYVFGNWYGTLRKPVEEAIAAGRTILLEIDVQGAIQIHNLYPNETFGIYILPPSYETLKQRMIDRGRDSEAEIERRFAEAVQEMRTAEACGAYDLMVVNRDHALAEVNEEIRKAVHRRLGLDEPRLFDE
jgi:guanylate kinase